MTIEVERKWDLRIGYDYRFGMVKFHVVNESTGEEDSLVVGLAQLIRHLAIQPEELRAFMADAINPAKLLELTDITPTRLRVLNETDWQGKVVLDVGGYDGFAAEIAHKAGASRAICLDNRQYDHYAANDPGHWLDVRKEGVEYITGDFMDYVAENAYLLADAIRMGPDRPPSMPRPDILIFYNVLYHLKNPWAALERLHSLVKPDGQMLLCTLFRYSDRPVWYYYDPRECNPEDESVFWSPSIIGLERVLRDTGWTFQQEGIAIDRVVYRCWPTLEVAGRESRV